MAIFIARLVFPGTALKLDHPKARDVEMLLGACQTMLAEAAVSCMLFDESFKFLGAPSKEEWEADRRRRMDLLLPAIGPDISARTVSDVLTRIDSQLQDERLSQGHLPQSYVNKLVFIYAKSFLYALDMIGKLLQQLAKIDGLPSGVSDEYEAFESRFPELRDVRDSTQHYEERIRGHQKGEPIDPKPIDRGGFRVDGKALVINNLIGNRFGNTLASGAYGEVEVSERSVKDAAEIIQRILYGLEWTGPGRVSP